MGVDEVDCRLAPPATNTSVSQPRDDSSEQLKASVSKELFTREYTQCNSIKFPTTTGHESRLRTRTDNSESVNNSRKDVNNVNEISAKEDSDLNTSTDTTSS